MVRVLTCCHEAMNPVSSNYRCILGGFCLEGIGIIIISVGWDTEEDG